MNTNGKPNQQVEFHYMSGNIKASYQKWWADKNWSIFLHLDEYSSRQYADKKYLLLMICGAALLLNDKHQAKKATQKAVAIIGKHATFRFLFALQNIQLACATYLANRPEKALGLFQPAYKEIGELATPLFYDFLIEQAEAQLAVGEARTAIQSFQDIAIILQEKTPEEVYHRMSHGYAVNRQGFGGTSEENQVWGDCHKHDLLEFFHQQLQPDFYFEIGVDEGRSLARAKGKALGVDARPELNLAVSLPEQAQILGISSDGFYQQLADEHLAQAPDLAFIDGMHLFEFALRDFINLERYAAPWTLVGVDDVFPCHPVQAERRRKSSAWTGDVWKLIPVLKKYRPELTLLQLPCMGTGLLLITGLDATNTQLTDHYEQILQDYQQNLPVPQAILQREHSIPSDHPVVSLLLSFLREAKVQQLSLAELRQKLATLQPLFNQAQTDTSTQRYPKSLERLQQEQQLEAQLNSTAQLFIPQPNSPIHTEAASLTQPFHLRGWQELLFEFEIQANNSRLRLDPTMQAGLLEIDEIKLINTETQAVVVHLQGEALRAELGLGGDCFLLKGTSRFCIYSFSQDPILFLPPVNATQQPLRLYIRLRHIDEGADQRALWHGHLKS